MPLLSSDDRKVLIVRHGKTRGPHIPLRQIRPEYFEPFLADHKSLRPDIRRRIKLWETGNEAPDLHGVAAILFLLQDPLQYHSPACYDEAKALEEKGLDRQIHVVNSPDAISAEKSEHSRLWHEIGLPTPEVAPFETHSQLLDAAQTFEFPAILKHNLLHAQSRMKFLPTLHDLEQIPTSEIPTPGSLCRFIDVRVGYQQEDPGSAFAEYFHKKRALVFGGHVRTNHLFFSSNPIVGSKTSTFAHGRSLNPVARWLEKRKYEQHFRLDWEYWDRETEHETDLLRAAKALKMEFVAIDYSTLADGTLVLWEANPHFALHVWPFGIYSRGRRLKERIAAFHRFFGQFILELTRT